MDRTQQLKLFLEPYLSDGRVGLEIAPWHSPLLPKANFPQTLTADIFPRDELVRRARAATPPIADAAIARIESVDFVGDASRLASLVPKEFHGTLGFIVSSHNFEHLPDPVQFLRDCEKLLAEDGVVVMAIPDKRACFDHWRPTSTIGQVAEAHVLHRINPGIAQQIDHVFGRAFVHEAGERRTVFALGTPEEGIDSDEETIPECAKQIRAMLAGEEDVKAGYLSAHCWTFTPESLALLIYDLQALGLVELGIDLISPTRGAEFFVRLTRHATRRVTRSELCRSLILAQSATYLSPQDDPRRYRRIYQLYMAALRILDRMLGRSRL